MIAGDVPLPAARVLPDRGRDARGAAGAVHRAGRPRRAAGSADAPPSPPPAHAGQLSTRGARCSSRRRSPPSLARARRAAGAYGLPARGRRRRRSPATARSSSPSTSPITGALPRHVSRHPAAQGRVDRPDRRQRERQGRTRAAAARISAASTRPARSTTSRPPSGSGSSGTSRPPARRGRSRSRYRFRGLAMAYDDVVDVNLKVWGDEWAAPLADLTAVAHAPAPGAARAALPRLGAPGLGERRRRTRRRRDDAPRAVNVPAHQFVELRVVFPRSLLTSTAGAQVRSAPGCRRSSPRSTPAAASYAERASTRRRQAPHRPDAPLPAPARARARARRHPARLARSSGASGGPATTASTSRQPPTDTEPALVPAAPPPGHGLPARRSSRRRSST